MRSPPTGLVHARLRLPDGSMEMMFPGDVIGRLWRAELQLNHPAVSELHAYLSHRGGRLWLLPLRGTLTVYGVASKEVALRPGLVISLASGVSLEVEDVSLPSELSALSVDGTLHALQRTRFSLSARGPEAPGAAAIECWSTGDDWFLQHRNGPIERLDPGVRVRVGGLDICLQDIRAPLAEATATEGRSDALPLRLIAQFETVRIHRSGNAAVLISGLQARTLSLLAEYGGPVHWELVARELWRNVDDTSQLRRRWDRVLWALRRRLRAEGLRSDLVLTNQGQVELGLAKQDTIEIAT